MAELIRASVGHYLRQVGDKTDDELVARAKEVAGGVFKGLIDWPDILVLGGMEFAREIVKELNLYRVKKQDRSLGAFIDDFVGFLKGYKWENG